MPGVHGVRRGLVVAATSLTIALAVSSTALAGPPPPGTPAEVAALVRAAPSITALPSDVTPPLSSASNDDALTRFPSLTPCISGSTAEPACVFGDTKGRKTMVLFGDSHALMWFPALDAVASAAKWRLIAFMNYGCPVADVTVWDVVTNGPDTGCPGFRSHMIRRIDRLHANVVVVSEGFYTLDASDHPITHAAWTAALERSLRALRETGTHLAVIGQSYLIPQPINCLSTYPSAIQMCSRPENVPSFTSELAADVKAARATKVAYVNEVPWLCSSECTAVIGNMIVYNSSGHLSATYDTYLTDVIGLALKASMR